MASAFQDGEKIGQVAALLRSIVLGGVREPVAELVDLFVAPQQRSSAAVSGIYQALKDAVAGAGVDKIFTYPNERARLLNHRFFNLDQLTALPVGVGWSPRFHRSQRAADLAVLDDVEAIAGVCEAYPEVAMAGLVWSRARLERRLASPCHRYVMVQNGDLALLASPRQIRGRRVLLLCASFSRTGDHLHHAGKGALLSALSRATGYHLYLYAGWNRQMKRPGVPLPRRLLGRIFVLQSNFLNSRADEIQRLELIDLDYG